MIMYIFILLSTYLTFNLINKGKFYTVTASALSTLLLISLATIISNTFANLLFLPLIELSIFGSSFIGMTSHKSITNKNLWIISIVFYLLLQIGLYFNKFFGGSLGFMAFVSTIIVVVLIHLKDNIKTFFIKK